MKSYQKNTSKYGRCDVLHTDPEWPRIPRLAKRHQIDSIGSDDENGTVEGTYLRNAYFDGAAEDSADCSFDPYGRYTRHVREYRQEEDVGYFDEDEGTLGIYYQFNESGLRTEAVYKVNDVPVAVFSYR